jgi:hypothetical protein
MMKLVLSLGESHMFMPFVARQYWWKRWATPHRFRAHGVNNGAFASGATRSLRINRHHRHMPIHCAIARNNNQVLPW